MAFSNWKQKGSPSVSIIVITAFVIKNAEVVKGKVHRKKEEEKTKKC